MKKEITITAKEYKKLLKNSERVKIFKDYVRQERFSVDRKTCAQLLGFAIEEG